MQTRVEIVGKRKREVKLYTILPRGNQFVMRTRTGPWKLLNDVLRDCVALEWDKNKGYMVIYK